MTESPPPGRSWLTGGAAAGGLAGAVVAAVASLCCAGPLTVLLLGAGGAVAAAGLEPYRLPLLAASAAFLGVGYWRSRRGATRGGTACPTRVGRWIRASLTLASLAWIVGATLWLASCAPSGRPSPYQVLGADAQPLRSAFNANTGKVRIILLVAPT